MHSSVPTNIRLEHRAQQWHLCRSAHRDHLVHLRRRDARVRQRISPNAHAPLEGGDRTSMSARPPPPPSAVSPPVARTVKVDDENHLRGTEVGVVCVSEREIATLSRLQIPFMLQQHISLH